MISGYPCSRKPPNMVCTSSHYVVQEVGSDVLSSKVGLVPSSARISLPSWLPNLTPLWQSILSMATVSWGKSHFRWIKPYANHIRGPHEVPIEPHAVVTDLPASCCVADTPASPTCFARRSELVNRERGSAWQWLGNWGTYGYLR